jgi:hypothetical protein
MRDGTISQKKYATIDMHIRVCKLVLQMISDFCPYSCCLLNTVSEIFKLVLTVFTHIIFLRLPYYFSVLQW